MRYKYKSHHMLWLCAYVQNIDITCGEIYIYISHAKEVLMNLLTDKSHTQSSIIFFSHH